MPCPRETFPVTPRISTPDENDKIMILHNACPKSWRDEQARTNQLDLDLQELLTYYSTLKSIEKGSDEDREKLNSRKKNKKNKDKPDNRENLTSSDPICPIRGTHSMSPCKIINAEKKKFQEKKKESPR